MCYPWSRVIALAATLLASCAAPPTTTGHDSGIQVVAGGMAVIDRTFPAKTGGYAGFNVSITVTHEPGFNGRTYWAHQWGYTNSPEGGYIGLQNRNGNDKVINFSIWGASQWKPGAATCNQFGHEGEGVQCSLAYPWQEGVTYTIHLARSGTDDWTASITDTASGKVTQVATIVAPGKGGMNYLSEWVENFAQGSDQPATCASVPQAVAVYGRPTMDGVASTTSSGRTYGDCVSIARATCTTEQVCTLSANGAIASQRHRLKNTISGFCLALGGTGAAELAQCADESSQWLTQDTSYRLAATAKPGQCLTAGTDTRVTAATCSGSARQQWLYVNRTKAYFNPGSGLCMDPLENAALHAPLRVFTCLGNGFQQWVVAP